jgi:hypothetical protein
MGNAGKFCQATFSECKFLTPHPGERRIQDTPGPQTQQVGRHTSCAQRRQAQSQVERHYLEDAREHTFFLDGDHVEYWIRRSKEALFFVLLHAYTRREEAPSTRHFSAQWMSVSRRLSRRQSTPCSIKRLMRRRIPEAEPLVSRTGGGAEFLV